MKTIIVFIVMAIVSLWIRLNTLIDVVHDLDDKLKLLARASVELNQRCGR